MDALDRVLASCGEGTGLGWDRLHPRQLRWLPPYYRQAFLDIVHSWERNPKRGPLWLMLVVFLPKPPPGGVRPILLASIWTRIWSKGRPIRRALTPSR